MYNWKAVKSGRNALEQSLNELEKDGWEVFNVIPTLSFVNTKIVMGVSAMLPQNVEYDILVRKRVVTQGGS
tara:strand:+ start:703 stop:915 length:213 start_codon:yes stop_codon:yes gene_type:complete